MLTLALATGRPAKAEESNYLLDFSQRATFNACTQTSLTYDHDGMDVWTYNNYGNYPYMYNYNITEPYYDDYLVTAGIELQAGRLYRLQTAPAAYNNGKIGRLDISIGQDENYEGYTLLQSFAELPYANASTAEMRTVDFSVPAGGIYRLAFRGVGNALYLYNTTLSDMGVSNVPAAVSELALLPAVDGSQSVTITFTLPSTTKSGAPLDGDLTYMIYRDDSTDPVKRGRGVRGENVSWTDTSVPFGNVTYSVMVSQGENESDRATASTYVGLETPLAVTNLTISRSGNTFNLSWTAPEVGVNGAVLNPDMLTYRVERFVDGVQDAVEVVATTGYTDNYSSEGIHSLQYKVFAVLGPNSSEEAVTAAQTVGSVALPFADSFANASFGDKWTTEVVEGTIDWVAVAEATDQQPRPTPQDGDGGMAKYRSWDAKSGHSARLITMPLSKASSSNPLLEFYLCRSSTNNNDIIKVEVSCDNGEWVVVPESEITVGKGTAGAWEKHSFSLTDIISPATDTYRVSITAVSGYGNNTFVDNVRIFNVSEYDLAVEVRAPESVISGNDLGITLTVANNGTHDVAAADYSIELISDYPGEIPAIETVDVPALERREISLSLPVNAPLAIDMSQYGIQAKVNYAADLVVANNLSEQLMTAVSFVDHQGVGEVESTVNPDNSILLSWESVGEGRLPVNIAESFESFEDGAEGPYNGFTVIDMDETAGSNYYTTNGSALHVINKGVVPTKIDGSKLLGCTTKAYNQQDDWLISPELNCAPGSTMKLQFAIAAKKFSSSYDYKYEVLYSTESYDPANPSAAFTNRLVSVTANNYSNVFRADEAMWEQTVDNIPADAKYVAIHLITKISYDAAVWLDNVRITEGVQFYLRGYNVYDTEGVKLNEELIPADATSYMVEATGTRTQKQYYVVAVYNDGEATPSPQTKISTGIANLSDGAAAISIVDNKVIVMNSDAEVAVYDAVGRKVAGSRAADRVELVLAPGVYVVKSGHLVKKVIVR